MVKELEPPVYQCEICGRVYKTIVDAEKCEESCRKSEYMLDNLDDYYENR